MTTIKGCFSTIIVMLFALPLLAQNSEIVINEFMAKNTNYAMDEAGQFDDYIELRNNNGIDYINLKNWTLTDTLGIPDKWTFPDSTTIAPHGYLVLWADEDGGQGDLHVNFKLDGDNEELYLFNPEGVMMDQVIFSDQIEDMSFSRIPNGTGEFVIKDGTIGFNNEHTSSIKNEIVAPHKIYPNPFNDIIYIEVEGEDVEQVQIFDLIGNKVLSEKMSSDKGFVDLSALEPGMYIITINGSLSDRLMKL